MNTKRFIFLVLAVFLAFGITPDPDRAYVQAAPHIYLDSGKHLLDMNNDVFIGAVYWNVFDQEKDITLRLYLDKPDHPRAFQGVDRFDVLLDGGSLMPLEFASGGGSDNRPRYIEMRLTADQLAQICRSDHATIVGTSLNLPITRRAKASLLKFLDEVRQAKVGAVGVDNQVHSWSIRGATPSRGTFLFLLLVASLALGFGLKRGIKQRSLTRASLRRATFGIITALVGASLLAITLAPVLNSLQLWLLPTKQSTGEIIRYEYKTERGQSYVQLSYVFPSEQGEISDETTISKVQLQYLRQHPLEIWYSISDPRINSTNRPSPAGLLKLVVSLLPGLFYAAGITALWRVGVPANSLKQSSAPHLTENEPSSEVDTPEMGRLAQRRSPPGHAATLPIHAGPPRIFLLPLTLSPFVILIIGHPSLANPQEVIMWGGLGLLLSTPLAAVLFSRRLTLSAHDLEYREITKKMSIPLSSLERIVVKHSPGAPTDVTVTIFQQGETKPCLKIPSSALDGKQLHTLLAELPGVARHVRVKYRERREQE